MAVIELLYQHMYDAKKIAENYISEHPEVSEYDDILVKPNGGERYVPDARGTYINKLYKVLKNKKGKLYAAENINGVYSDDVEEKEPSAASEENNGDFFDKQIMAGNNKKRKSIRRKSIRRKSNNRKSKSINRRKRTTRRK